ncbi:PREDICTED: putative 2-oxo-4-hydroxy-4-carboxy-5-ureidoimidazoline decarboxylase [Galeopterus variegatus]|uniref:2-oxo-4-hydroxy-4-carboxy-5-ureidoimidazoline decarboxylase n=1 Tax=Galeopterus variegatus TaxID=482537 RepID=A0ABM0S127_GALVR|nr:PREDICTED: putative 2-oxo-4-hydroxy-4-carboxy-5-ureidoimidazoline decarboxylase [Galeopterus variegatus]
MDTEKVSSMDSGEFTDVFGNVIERCPLIAATVWSQRPFSDLEDLEKLFFAFIDSLLQEDREGVPCCHPGLAGRELQRGTLTAESQREQSGLHCPPAQELRTALGDVQKICHLRLASLLGAGPARLSWPVAGYGELVNPNPGHQSPAGLSSSLRRRPERPLRARTRQSTGRRGDERGPLHVGARPRSIQAEATGGAYFPLREERKDEGRSSRGQVTRGRRGLAGQFSTAPSRSKQRHALGFCRPRPGRDTFSFLSSGAQDAGDEPRVQGPGHRPGPQRARQPQPRNEGAPRGAAGDERQGAQKWSTQIPG